MPVYTAEAWVDAPPDQVWEVLVGLDRYPEWNPFTPRVVSDLEVGSTVALTTNLGWIRFTQVEWILEVVCGERLVWGGVLYGGLIRAERVQTLTPEAGGTRYRSVDRIEGPASLVVRLLFGGALERGFHEMAAALQARAAG